MKTCSNYDDSRRISDGNYTIYPNKRFSPFQVYCNFCAKPISKIKKYHIMDLDRLSNIAFLNRLEIVQSHFFLMSQKFKMQGFQWYGVKRNKSNFVDMDNSRTRFRATLYYLNYRSHFFNKRISSSTSLKQKNKNSFKTTIRKDWTGDVIQIKVITNKQSKSFH